MDSHWAVTTSSGRRVSLLCDEGINYTPSYAPSSVSTTPTPPPSPGYQRPYAPIRADSISSACSSTSSLSTVSSQGYYSPKTPPLMSMSLPPLEKLMPITSSDNYFVTRKFTPEIHSPVIAPALLADISKPAASATPKRKPADTTTTTAATGTDGAPPKRSSRRYTCHCAKSFTTSGHLARHTRIHTGEKNYVCPEANCGARFSRQDNCMQHYRTHSSTSGSKRSSRKLRRLSVDSSVSTASSAATATSTAPEHCYVPPLSQFPGDTGGLAALATVACEASS